MPALQADSNGSGIVCGAIVAVNPSRQEELRSLVSNVLCEVNC